MGSCRIGHGYTWVLLLGPSWGHVMSIDLTKPETDRATWIGVGACLIVAGLLICIPQCGCVGVDPSAAMGKATAEPQLTAAVIKNAVQTAINSNASIVNDLWPVVVMVLIAVVGLVLVKKFNTDQTSEINEHIANGHS